MIPLGRARRGCGVRAISSVMATTASASPHLPSASFPSWWKFYDSASLSFSTCLQSKQQGVFLRAPEPSFQRQSGYFGNLQLLSIAARAAAPGFSHHAQGVSPEAKRALSVPRRGNRLAGMSVMSGVCPGQGFCVPPPASSGDHLGGMWRMSRLRNSWRSPKGQGNIGCWRRSCLVSSSTPVGTKTIGQCLPTPETGRNNHERHRMSSMRMLRAAGQSVPGYGFRGH